MNKIVMIIVLVLVFGVNANANTFASKQSYNCSFDNVICPQGALW